jgi:transposase-like protein
MNESYQINDPSNSQALTKVLSKNGQLLIPMLKLIEDARMAVDQAIDVSGRATIQALLLLSAQETAGEKHPGKSSGDIRWHGTQNGVVHLAERKLRVTKPRLRKKGVGGKGAEVPIPVYEALQRDGPTSQRMLEILLSGVSTRRYKDVLPEMAQSVGISKSSVSREVIAASEQQLKELLEKDLSQTTILVIYLDGIQFGKHHVLCAVGVDPQGYKHVLGLAAGASENATVVKELLEGLVARGLDPKEPRLFVIDGAKALRAGIATIFGTHHAVQRCRNHKIRNVVDRLPKEQQQQTKSAMRAAFTMEAKEGTKKLEQLAGWLERGGWQAAADSLREGMSEMFTLNRLDLPEKLCRCLCTTNLIDSSHSGVREKTHRISNWQNESMALRWAATSLLATAGRFRRIMGYQQIWILQQNLKRFAEASEVATQRKAG